MFGGQDDNAGEPQNGGGASQDNTLNGVSDLAEGENAPDNQEGGFMPVPSEPAQTDAPAPDDNDTSSPAPAGDSMDSGNDGLLELKQQALQQLTPIVGHLDQTPEEKFRTTMMLIQASDNQALLKEAYESAQTIEDEKVRAQALLDVVNEINYFTQK